MKITKTLLHIVTPALLALVGTVIGCPTDSEEESDGDTVVLPDDGSEVESSESEGDEAPPLLGCKNPDNWNCDPPSPGYEFGCVAVCDGDIMMTCNQVYNGGVCILAPSGDKCDAPQAGEGCEICTEAILNQCASDIPVDP
ncbi:MAG: hypothetical protein HC927_02410 [Deltaproteobacteria bacterium]|nr:hypothetical protein [Deltaproteobacteria bacterium]